MKERNESRERKSATGEKRQGGRQKRKGKKSGRNQRQNIRRRKEKVISSDLFASQIRREWNSTVVQNNQESGQKSWATYSSDCSFVPGVNHLLAPCSALHPASFVLFALCCSLCTAPFASPMCSTALIYSLAPSFSFLSSWESELGCSEL